MPISAEGKLIQDILREAHARCRQPIWDGKGEADGFVYFTKDNGEIVGRPYLRRRAVAALSRFRRWRSDVDRAATLAATIDNDEWLAFRNLNTVSAICRAVVEHVI